MPSTKSANGDIHFHQKVKGWFTRNSANRDRDNAASSQQNTSSSGHGHSTPRSDSHNTTSSSGNTKSFRQTKFWTVGRLRSATTASEGNPLDPEVLSPTAHANPYFAHQGQPGLRHRNDTPPDTPSIHIDTAPDDPSADKATAARKEDLARKLRRVASAPNAQGLFSKGAKAAASGSKNAGDGGGDVSVLEKIGSVSKDTKKGGDDDDDDEKLGFANPSDSDGKDKDGLGALPPPPSQSALAFRRTYSSNSIKVRDVEVGPQSFDKIKLIGKGDVGKVYLVREKKSGRLYAMKGAYIYLS
jgi:protein-serine/threonine kinase